MDEKRKVTQEELDNACILHNKYIEGEDGGKQAVFENCSFERLSFNNKQCNSAVFRNCDFKLCDLSDTGMCFAELNNVKFSGCDCTMFTAEEAAFREVTFDKCDLRSAVFTHSSLRNIAFEKCDTEKMSMQNCYELPEAEIIKIAAEDLRKMNNKEGLILQGCGGDLQEWADGINSTLADAGILRSPFDKLYVFEHEGLTNIMFPFEDVELDIGKLAMWRLQTHEQFGGTWLSDYVPNRLGGFIEEHSEQEQKKPDCPLIGEDSNIFHLMGIRTARMSELLKLSRNDQQQLFDYIVGIGAKKALSPLTVVFTFSYAPVFAETFYCPDESIEDRCNTITNTMKDLMDHQSHESTDVRFIALYFTLLSGNIHMQQNHVEILNTYPTSSHDDEVMRMVPSADP